MLVCLGYWKVPSQKEKSWSCLLPLNVPKESSSISCSVSVCLMLNAVRCLSLFSASFLPVSPLFLSCLDGSSAEAHLSRCSSCRKKKNQFHRRCKDVITLHTEYKPVSRLTIWFQLNYLYTPYFLGWGDRFQAHRLTSCSRHRFPLVVNYAILWVCCRLDGEILKWGKWSPNKGLRSSGDSDLVL